MRSRYESSPANLRALRDRLTQAAKREGVLDLIADSGDPILWG